MHHDLLDSPAPLPLLARQAPLPPPRLLRLLLLLYRWRRCGIAARPPFWGAQQLLCGPAEQLEAILWSGDPTPILKQAAGLQARAVPLTWPARQPKRQRAPLVAKSGVMLS